MLTRWIAGVTAVVVALACIGLLILQAVQPFSVHYLELNLSGGFSSRMPLVPLALIVVGLIALLVAMWQVESVLEPQDVPDDAETADTPQGESDNNTEVMEQPTDPR